MKIILALLYLIQIMGGYLIIWYSIYEMSRRYLSDSQTILLAIIGVVLVVLGSFLFYLTFGRSEKD